MWEGSDMAAVTVDFFSESLEVGASVAVVLPQATEAQIGVEPAAGAEEDMPVLYLLHGLSDDHTAWTRYTSIERYAAAAGLAVVMPAVGRSFYADERNGHRYWTYLSEELPQVMHSFFRFSDRCQDTFVAGLSMGGYGALRLGLTHPDRFAAVASLSGAVDVAALVQQGERRALFDRIYGRRKPPRADEDLVALLENADPAALPPLYIGCGTEDPLLPFSERFAERAEAAGAKVTTDFRSGEHEWGLWDTVIQDVIAWLPRD
jgi:putative tributyrin esterase